MKHETRLIILLTVLSAVMAVPECRSGADAEELPQTTHIQNTPVQVEIRLSSSPTPEIAVSSNEIIYGLAVRYAREEQYPQNPEIAIVSSDYHILRASVLVQARSIPGLRSADGEPVRVVSNAACRTDRKDVSSAMIIWNILQLTGDADLLALVRNEVFAFPGKMNMSCRVF